VNLYVDSSILLRFVLGQADRFLGLLQASRCISSTLLEVECLRALDRAQLSRVYDDDEIAAQHGAAYHLLRRTDLVELTASVLGRAAAPLPVALGTLDAIHLATAQVLRDRRYPELQLATHDMALARAGRALGFAVHGA
jgi:hypothetical protein